LVQSKPFLNVLAPPRVSCPGVCVGGFVRHDRDIFFKWCRKTLLRLSRGTVLQTQRLERPVVCRCKCLENLPLITKSERKRGGTRVFQEIWALGLLRQSELPPFIGPKEGTFSGSREGTDPPQGTFAVQKRVSAPKRVLLWSNAGVVVSRGLGYWKDCAPTLGYISG